MHFSKHFLYFCKAFSIFPVLLICPYSGSDSKESACNAGDWVWSLGWEDTLEKGMDTHSSIIVWRIPQTEEPGGLESMGHKELDTSEWLTLQYFIR